MKIRKAPVFRSTTTAEWTRERVERLQKAEIEQLRSNAAGLGADNIVTLCDEVLKERPK